MSSCGTQQQFMGWTAPLYQRHQLTGFRPLPSSLPSPPCIHNSTVMLAPRPLPLAAHIISTTSTPSVLTSSSWQGGAFQFVGPLQSSVDLETTSSSSTGVGTDKAVHGRGTSSPSDRGPSTSGSGPPGDGRDEFAANFGEAVIALREDLPCLFERDPRFHIFRDDLTFRTPSMRYSTGLWKYKVLHRAARYLGNLLYADMQLSLSRMWQPSGNRRQLRVRWCVSGRPRLSLSVDDKQSTEVISTYTFDSKGKIFEHQVDQIIPPESMLVRLFEWLVGQLQPGMVPQPQLPLPGLRDGMSSARD